MRVCASEFLQILLIRVPRGEFVSYNHSASLLQAVPLPVSVFWHVPTFCCFLPDVAAFSSIAESEDMLLKHLFQGYQKWVRPVQNSNDTIKVLFGLKISQLVDVVSVAFGLAKHPFFYRQSCIRLAGLVMQLVFAS